MGTEKERLQTAQWVLERNLAWIAAAEAKVGAIVAIDTAMLGGLGAAFSAADVHFRTYWAVLFTLVAAILISGGLTTAAMAMLPRMKGPTKSLLFFGRIGEVAEPDYIDAFRTVTAQQLLEDWSAQIHRNAQIACDKFILVRQAMIWSFLAILPWFAAIVTLIHREAGT
ncbi:Pycsar system effector family protein [Methylibium petroleiphilum]|uniref:Pycsar system effector family protein n=1 Tax=Methylibium petroleiphilum TaxID=105560 RepID=UPI003D273387